MLEKRKAEQFRKTLISQAEQLKKELSQSTNQHLHDEEEVYADWTDVATVETDKAMQMKILDRERDNLEKIEAALRRIEDKSFGECERCGEAISESRLKARPTTTLCIDCMTEIEGTTRHFR